MSIFGVRAALLGVSCLAGMAWPGSAEAASGRLSWTSFLYAGPGYRTQVIDELPQGSRFDVTGCSGDWCHIEAGGIAGYLHADVVQRDGASGVLAQPADRPIISPKGPCVEAVQTGGNGGHLNQTICQR